METTRQDYATRRNNAFNSLLAKKQPEQWEIVLITPKGIKTEILTPLTTTIKDFEFAMVQKYGSFVMHTSKLI